MTRSAYDGKTAVLTYTDKTGETRTIVGLGQAGALVVDAVEASCGPCCPPGRCRDGHADSLDCARWRPSRGPATATLQGRLVLSEDDPE